MIWFQGSNWCCADFIHASNPLRIVCLFHTILYLFSILIRIFVPCDFDSREEFRLVRKKHLTLLSRSKVLRMRGQEAFGKCENPVLLNYMVVVSWINGISFNVADLWKPCMILWLCLVHWILSYVQDPKHVQTLCQVDWTKIKFKTSGLSTSWSSQLISNQILASVQKSTTSWRITHLWLYFTTFGTDSLIQPSSQRCTLLCPS